MINKRLAKLAVTVIAGCYLQISSGAEGPVGESAKDLETSGRTALESNDYETALCLFETGAARATDPGIKANLDFRQAYTLQQMAEQETDPQEKISLLRDAARFYEAYREHRPDSAAGANNLGRVYEDIGIQLQGRKSGKQADTNFAKADDLYRQAVNTGKDDQLGLYLKNYAEFLTRTGQWEEAKDCYAKLIQDQPLSHDLRQSMEAAYSSRGLDSLAEYLWMMLDAGYIQQARDRAMDELEKTAGESNAARINLLTIVSVGLAKDTYATDDFQTMDIATRIEALAMDPYIGDGAAGITRLHQAQPLAVKTFSWWAQPESALEKPSVGMWPVDGFRVLVRSLGNRARQSENIERAATYYALAAKLQNLTVDPLAVRDMVYMYAELGRFDEIDRVLEEYGPPLYDAKEQAYLEVRLDEIFQYHQTLGELYALIERWGNSEQIPSAIFQLEHAQTTSLLVADTATQGQPEFYLFTPYMVDLLAAGYEATGRSDEAVWLRIDWANNYHKVGNRDAACEVLESIKGKTVPESPIPRYRNLLAKLPDCGVDIVPAEPEPEDYFSVQIEQAERYRQAGNACAARDILYQLQESVIPPDLKSRYQSLIEYSNTCQPPPVVTHYIGDDVRIGIGYTSETDLTGEFFWNFLEDSDSAYSIEGWKGNESSGGLKMNFHWLTDGVVAGVDAAGNPVYSDGKVRKLFIAADQNIFADGKLTFGGGSERQDRFWSLYASKSITGKRHLGQNVDIETLVESGIVDNHAYTQTDTWTTTTDLWAHPYEWGIGVRVGRFFDNSLVRLKGGFDYEDGDFSSNQLSGFASIDKRFNNSSHGLSLRAEIVRKNGDFEIDKNDLRLSAFWSWDFGETFRTVQALPTTLPSPGQGPHSSPAVQSADMLTADTTPTDNDSNNHEALNAPMMEVAENQVILRNAGFGFDSDSLNPDVKTELRKIIGAINNRETRIVGDIQVIGHTCSMGDDDYNQDLSGRRAQTVFDFLVREISEDVGTNILPPQGRGEKEPRYSNCTEKSRARNRRVEIIFTSEDLVAAADEQLSSSDAQVLASVAGSNASETTAGQVQQQLPAEAAWIRRALRNPVSHKRTVDYYRYNRVSEQHATERELINVGPEAQDDVYEVEQDSTNNSLNVLENDYDPENDNLKIISTSSPAHGTVTINGNSVSYTPNTGYSGPDSFSYQIEDIFVTEPHAPGQASTAQVSINVIPTNNPPEAMDDDYPVMKNTSDNPFQVLENDTDPDGDEISIIEVGVPMNGTVTFTGDVILYTPNAGYTGTDLFEYRITDGNGGEDTAWVTVTIANKPPLAVDDYAKTWKNTSVVIDVLANDSDPDGDPLTIVAIIQDEHPMGTVIDNGDGTLTYTPMRGWWGGDAFQYTISDGELTSTATVTLDVIHNIWN